MKILFSKNADGTISATNSKIFKSFFVKDLSESSKYLYAVIDITLYKVVVISNKEGIKLMFEQPNGSYQRMFIEDKDILYTTKEEAENTIKNIKLLNEYKEKISNLNKSITKLSKDLNDKISNIDWHKNIYNISNYFKENFDSFYKKYNDKFKDYINTLGQENTKFTLEEEKKNLEKRLDEINNKLNNIFTEIQ